MHDDLPGETVLSSPLLQPLRTLCEQNDHMKRVYGVEVLFIPLAVAGFVWNIIKVLEHCQILESKKD